ncbi:MAG: VOC family protein [Rhodanobacteraceae bacterium]
MIAQALRLLRVERNVRDLDRAQSFYCGALGFTAVSENREARPAWSQLPGVCAAPPRSVRLRLRAQQIELTAFDAPGAPYPADSSSADLWFQHCAIVVDDMEAAYARLLRHGGVTAISRDGPQTLPPSSGGVIAYKFRDPDGHPLELMAFPQDVGDPVWHHMNSDGAMLGIDHSAISVASADRSITFYAGLLGFTLTTRQTNRGPEQDLLDALSDVAVDVIALQPEEARTPHIELLGYRTPRGRAPSSIAVCDIAADRLVLKVRGLPALLETTADANVIATGAVDSADGSQAAVLRDPDGHLLVLIV